MHVEQERGGRLAKLDSLTADLRRLKRAALDNSAHLDDAVRVNALLAALRAVQRASVDAPARTPFRNELRVLCRLKPDDVVLETLDASDAPDMGVDPAKDLADWFTTSVAPRVKEVALVPEENAGVLAHLTALLLSPLMFRRAGMVEGDDVLSVLARAEHYLNEQDLDSAAREVNQLKGTPKMLVKDWLEAVRRRLEVAQALEVRLASLKNFNR